MTRELRDRHRTAYLQRFQHRWFVLKFICSSRRHSITSRTIAALQARCGSGRQPVKSERSSTPLADALGVDALELFFGTSVVTMRLPDRRCGTRRLSQHKASGGPRGSDGRAGRLQDNASGVDDLAVAGPSPSCPTLLRLSHPSVMTAAARGRQVGWYRATCSTRTPPSTFDEGDRPRSSSASGPCSQATR
jgi:hypothetical protein